MPSTFFGLSIATSGLYTYQAALNITGHNVSNAETPGYSRQAIVQRASRAISVSSSYGMCGTGVNATGVIQYRNEYYDVKYWNNNCTLGSYKSKQYYMKSIENYFSEVNSDGTTATFDEFNKALSTLATDGKNLTMRTQVASYGVNFTEYIKSMANSLQSLQKECNSEIKTTADRINSIAESIATITKQINTLEMTGNRANDLRDSRALLIDELSELANVKVSEQAVGDTGKTIYTVTLDGQLLVDNYEYTTLKCVTNKTTTSQNDAEGMYSLQWSNGASFNCYSKTLGGRLQGLFEVRDGNNQENLRGLTTGKKGDKTVTMTQTTCDDINKLNIPASNGVIIIDNTKYEYNSFSIKKNTDGTYEYTFDLKKELLTDVNGESSRIGESIDYKGIPYYMAQLNEFARTYASSFNELHNQGEGLKGNKGVDFFNATHKTTGENFDFSESLEVGVSYSSLATTNGLASYYSMTALNITVAQSILDDPNTIAAASKIADGVENVDILNKLIALKSDQGMFKQGAPDSFLQTFTAQIGVDTKKATTFVDSQTNILTAIKTQRMSISSVDNDEEAVSLVKYKNAYDLSAKVIQVLNEIYDRLINGMGV